MIPQKIIEDLSLKPVDFSIGDSLLNGCTVLEMSNTVITYIADCDMHGHPMTDRLLDYVTNGNMDRCSYIPIDLAHNTDALKNYISEGPIKRLFEDQKKETEV